MSETNTGKSTYTYDAAGNLQSVAYPNGVAHTYSYDQKNRLTNLGVNGPSGPLKSYAYTLENAGHRTSVTELSGRTVNYGYDNIYRLTSEAVAFDPSGNNGTIGYTYDSVGNRTQQTSTNPAISTGGFSYDADDRLTTDSYDGNGNTIGSGGLTYAYDFENHLIQQGGATFVYDGDGNRVQKTVAGITTKYLVSPVNPTGYAQVVYQTFSGTGITEYWRQFVYGLDRISQYRSAQSGTQKSFYVYDGHGSVRALTDGSGNVTDTYDYDAFGNVTHQTGTTPNEFLFAGEQYDSNLHLYYNRARYLDTSTGRFWSMDTYEGIPQEPLSTHKYLYTEANPVTNLDPTGNQIDAVAEADIDLELDTLPSISEQSVLEAPPPSAPAAPAGAPPATIPNAPLPVSFGSAVGRAVVALTALGLATSLVSDNPIPATQPRPGDENSLIVYRDAGGPSPSDFSPSTTSFSTTGWGLSLLQQPQRNKKWIVPFTVTYRGALGNRYNRRRRGFDVCRVHGRSSPDNL